MRKMKMLSAAMLFAAALVPETAGAQEDISSCTSGNGEAGIVACSRLLLKGGFDKEDRAQMYSRRGFLISLDRRDYKEAAKDYTRAIELSESESVSYPYYLEGRCRVRAFGNFELPEGLEDCNEALRRVDTDMLGKVGFLYSRAFLFVRMDRLDEALADLNAGIGDAKAPSLITLQSWALRGIVHSKMGNAAAAEKDFRHTRGQEKRIREIYRIQY